MRGERLELLVNKTENLSANVNTFTFDLLLNTVLEENIVLKVNFFL